MKRVEDMNAEELGRKILWHLDYVKRVEMDAVLTETFVRLRAYEAAKNIADHQDDSNNICGSIRAAMAAARKGD